ncbi:MAG: thioesterase family protein [Candidatus Nanopelagicales bacterium]|nr:thioesterase family protein [Candidatus Nanopelagicales bacterium]
MRVRVPVYRRFSDLDPLGHVNNVVFIDYLQEGRVGFMRAIGLPVGTVTQVVVKQNLTFRKPLNLHPDPVIVETWVARLGNSSYDFSYLIYDEVGDLSAGGATTMACIDRESGRPIRLPAELRAAIGTPRLEA